MRLKWKSRFLLFIEMKQSSKIVTNLGPLPLTLSTIFNKNPFLLIIRFRNLLSEFNYIPLLKKYKTVLIIISFQNRILTFEFAHRKINRIVKFISKSDLNCENRNKLYTSLKIYGFQSSALSLRMQELEIANECSNECLNFKFHVIDKFLFGTNTENIGSDFFLTLNEDERFFLDVLGGKEASFENRIRKHETRPGFDSVANSLRAANIAIVAPGYSEISQGKEIDQFDFVLRFNASDIPRNRETYVGSRTDISFEVFNKMRPLEIFLPEAMSRCSIIWSQTRFTPDGNYPFFWQSDFKNKIWKGGEPFGVLRAILELIPFGPKEIKIFNSNFGLQENLYDSSQDNSFATEGIPWIFWYWASTVGHDHISNFVALQKIYRNGLFEADEVLDSLLQLDTIDFCSKFDNLYYKKIKMRDFYARV